LDNSLDRVGVVAHEGLKLNGPIVRLSFYRQRCNSAPIVTRSKEFNDMSRWFSATVASSVVIALVVGFVEVTEGQDGRRRDRGPRGPVADFPLMPLPESFATPANNPQSQAKVELGRLLFWDPILSGNQEVACGTCHHPDFGYAEDLDISIGVDGAGLGSRRRFVGDDPIPFVKRNSQTVLNAAFNGIDLDGNYDPSTAPMFWDVRAEGLESQALLPIVTFEEMRGHAFTEDEALEAVVNRLDENAEYRSLFAEAFGGDHAVNSENLGRALAAFQRTLVANNSPYDRYMRGEPDAMTRAQRTGMRRFVEVGCINCHNGPMFSDYELHVLGLRDNRKLSESDRGTEQTYAFRTPSLRNLAYTAPYMHNGILRDLDDVLEFYDDVGDRDERNINLRRDQLDPLIRNLDDVDDHEDEIIEFLEALNDDSFDKRIPERVPSGLNPGGRIG
jgi:cytochrome c peroxidase